GHFETGWREKKDETELIVSELELPDGTRMTLWQLAGDMTPLRADIRSADRVEIRLDITQFD
ncbi:MAG: hypothetical protein LBL15_05515, partial [Oscillospiraceae bacterium]|nr:hypothetical protein [Oscillospiraceae bacterium]